MSLSVLWLIIGLAILLVGAGVWWASRRRPLPTRETSRKLTEQPSIFDLRIGDIVQHLGQDWVVEGKLVYQEGGFSWLDYMLQDGDEIRWLSVEEDDWVTVSLLAPVSSLEISATPPEELVYDGDTYRQTESGRAAMRREGNPRRPQAETCRYFDYTGPDKKVLSIEDWDGDFEVTAGTIIAPRSLLILPGEGRSVYQE
jgi:hypothetical protein